MFFVLSSCFGLWFTNSILLASGLMNINGGFVTVSTTFSGIKIYFYLDVYCVFTLSFVGLFLIIFGSSLNLFIFDINATGEFAVRLSLPVSAGDEGSNK